MMSQAGMTPANPVRLLLAKPWPILLVVTALSLSLSGCSQEKTIIAQPASEQTTTQTTTTSTTSTSRMNPSAPPAAKPMPTAQNTVIIPGKSIGEITARTTLNDLQRLYGNENVKAGEVSGPEGTMLPGAELFPSDPQRKMTLYWKETAKTVTETRSKARPDGAKHTPGSGQGPGSGQSDDSQVAPKASLNNPTVSAVVIDEPGSVWHTEEGIKMGTSLKELEKINGQPFTLSGFDWDYGGMVLSWGNKGKLREKFQKTGGLALQLYPPEKSHGDSSKISGDGSFSSGNPDMQKLNPVVTRISVFLQ